ncbi:hypothetical protein SDRG_02388 [Saprolegnia diclina VS20]|uniref:Uncharacterized protein n=1 Tax=Saprolegnia diclina (strain VS20) TaxID=1156394 RepID=T0SCH3_SAPDV|nr:hypothetical protein SDRG_02388 [Saprolegnia diclina VS20]EQC40497.1 hypothetical protein SDRG_02388 [Saprolegnia diclina VS20]|eukprot:XP_008606196.1 hypothetical protein SDRG_02388 [Saprolegnia diclina VS20]
MGPRSDDGYRQRGLIYTLFGKFDLALVDYDRVVELESRQLTHVKLESLLQRAETLMQFVENEENGFLLHQMKDSALLSAENGHDRASFNVVAARGDTYIRAGALTNALADLDAALLTDAKDNRVIALAPPLIATQGLFRGARL